MNIVTIETSTHMTFCNNLFFARHSNTWMNRKMHFQNDYIIRTFKDRIPCKKPCIINRAKKLKHCNSTKRVSKFRSTFDGRKNSTAVELTLKLPFASARNLFNSRLHNTATIKLNPLCRGRIPTRPLQTSRFPTYKVTPLFLCTQWTMNSSSGYILEFSSALLHFLRPTRSLRM